MHPRIGRKVAKERFSYPLRVGLARSGGRVSAGLVDGNLTPSFRARGARTRNPLILPLDSGFIAIGPAMGRIR